MMMSSEVQQVPLSCSSESLQLPPHPQSHTSADAARHVHFVEGRMSSRPNNFSSRRPHMSRQVSSNGGCGGGAPGGGGGRRKRSHSCSWGGDPNTGGSRSKRRRTHHNISTSKFLMGGNINDPLNLGALSPKRNDQHRGVAVPVVIPLNINDPLNLNFDAPSDSEEPSHPPAINYVPPSKRATQPGTDQSVRRRRKSKLKRRRRRFSEPGGSHIKGPDLDLASFLLSEVDNNNHLSSSADGSVIHHSEDNNHDGPMATAQLCHVTDRPSSVDNPNAKVVFGVRPVACKSNGGIYAGSGPRIMKSISTSALEMAGLQESSAPEDDLVDDDSELDRSPSKLVVVERDSQLEESITEDSDVSLGLVRSTPVPPSSLKISSAASVSPNKLCSPSTPVRSPLSLGPGSGPSSSKIKRLSWDASTPGPSGLKVFSPVLGNKASLLKVSFDTPETNSSCNKEEDNKGHSSRTNANKNTQHDTKSKEQEKLSLLPADVENKNNMGCKKTFQYGNYHQYYGYRNPQHNTDPRLAFLNPRWFDGRDVLDVGCNIGHVTLTVARDFNPRFVTGIDIDKKLINIANKNVRHYLTKGKGLQGFPKGFERVYGGLPCQEELEQQETANKMGPEEREEFQQRLRKRKRLFPHNVTFRKANYVPETEELLEMVRPQFDVILCLSVSKWVHLNWGDEGLKRFFRRAYLNLRPGGRLVLEPQPWASYAKRKKLTPQIFENYKNIKLMPDMFEEYLVRVVGFSDCHTLAIPTHSSKGFQRPIQVYTKDGGPSTELADPEYVSALRVPQSNTTARDCSHDGTEGAREVHYPQQRNYPTRCLGFRERFQFTSPYPSPFPSPHPGPSPNNFVSGSEQVSPEYSPRSPIYPHATSSPRLAPTSPSYISPSYAPSPPRYCPVSPTYQPTPPSYSPASPAALSPVYYPTSSPYAPSSPSHAPPSPSYKTPSDHQSPKSYHGSPQNSPTWPHYPYASPSSEYDLRGSNMDGGAQGSSSADGSSWSKFYKKTVGEEAGGSSSVTPRFTTTYQPSWVLSPGQASNPSPRPSGLSPSSASPQNDSPNTFASPYPYASPHPSASPRPTASPHSFPSPVPSASQLSVFPHASPHLYSFPATLPSASHNPMDSPNAAASPNASPYPASASPSYSPNPALSPNQGASPNPASSPYPSSSPNTFASPNPVASPCPAASPSGSSPASASPNPSSQQPFVSPNPSYSPNLSPHPSVSPNVSSYHHCFASPHPSASPRPHASSRSGAQNAKPSASPQSSASPRPAASPYPSTSTSPHQSNLYCLAPFSASPHPSSISPHPSSNSPHPSSNSPHPSSLSPHPSSNSPHPSSISPHPASNSPHPSSLSPHPSSNSPHPSSNSPHPASNSPHPSSNSPHPSSNLLHPSSYSPLPSSSPCANLSPGGSHNLSALTPPSIEVPHLYSSALETSALPIAGSPMSLHASESPFFRTACAGGEESPKAGTEEGNLEEGLIEAAEIEAGNDDEDLADDINGGAEFIEEINEDQELVVEKKDEEEPLKEGNDGEELLDRSYGEELPAERNKEPLNERNEEEELLGDRSDGLELNDERDEEFLDGRNEAPLDERSDGEELLDVRNMEPLEERSDGELLLGEGNEEPLNERSDGKKILDGRNEDMLRHAGNGVWTREDLGEVDGGSGGPVLSNEIVEEHSLVDGPCITERRRSVYDMSRVEGRQVDNDPVVEFVHENSSAIDDFARVIGRPAILDRPEVDSAESASAEPDAAGTEPVVASAKLDQASTESNVATGV
ncbi:uncharacterized protein LOC108671617 [Hyalella azteca]|uniref:RNA methyltransferase n=1 Tax=Hyalella azteca TaxID=294128 RepID=A0A8B7NLX4_HYAAZ|nr:uncharacterized protein LOC108671617 [Hyalella azteca]